MTLKMSKELALALVRGWAADDKLRCLSDECVKELRSLDIKPFFVERVRVFLARSNRAVSDLLWNGDQRKAAVFLCKTGLPDRLQLHMKNHIGARKFSFGGAEQNRIVSARMFGRNSSPEHDWHYVK